MPEYTASQWDALISHYPNAHLMQTSPWGDLKSSFGWQVARLGSGDSPGQPAQVGAQILFKRLFLGFSLAYIPKGPVGNGWDGLWPEIDALCRRRRVIFLKIEPDVWESEMGEGQTGSSSFYPPGNCRPSPHSIQPIRTMIVDLQGDEEAILERMKQKTRYNIKLAQKKGVVVHPSSDLDTFYQLMQITGQRDQFGVHNRDYYQRAYDLFHPRGMCELLLAVHQDEPLAGLMVFASGKRAWYFYGASASNHRDLMPTYLIQWEAMRWARAHGCIQYDLWGVPDADEATLEANFTRRSDGLWGVYRFKRGFGGALQRAAGPWDCIYISILYHLYRWLIQRRSNGLR